MDQGFLKLALGSFAAILAVLNPFSLIPVFLGVTQGAKPAVRRDMAIVIGIFTLVALISCLLVGEIILKFFGISIPAFQIAGGILLFSTGLHMIRGTSTTVEKFAKADTGQSNFNEARARFRDLIVPIGTPLFVGPGSISTVVLYGNQAGKLENPAFGIAAVAAGCVACALTSIVVLVSASGLAKILRESGIAILSRLMGLILCAISIQFVISALAVILPNTVHLPLN